MSWRARRVVLVLPLLVVGAVALWPRSAPEADVMDPVIEPSSGNTARHIGRRERSARSGTRSRSSTGEGRTRRHVQRPTTGYSWAGNRHVIYRGDHSGPERSGALDGDDGWQPYATRSRYGPDSLPREREPESDR